MSPKTEFRTTIAFMSVLPIVGALSVASDVVLRQSVSVETLAKLIPFGLVVFGLVKLTRGSNGARIGLLLYWILATLIALGATGLLIWITLTDTQSTSDSSSFYIVLTFTSILLTAIFLIFPIRSLAFSRSFRNYLAALKESNDARDKEKSIANAKLLGMDTNEWREGFGPKSDE